MSAQVVVPEVRQFGGRELLASRSLAPGAGSGAGRWDVTRDSVRSSANGVRPDGVHGSIGRRTASRGGGRARSCTYGVPAAVAPAARVAASEPRLQLTERGVMVSVLAVLVVVGVMVATMVGAFLAVSPEPPTPAVAAVMVAQDVPSTQS